MLQQRRLGKKGPKVAALGLGCMGMSVFYGPTDEAQATQVMQQAYDRGVTLFDTADMYGDNELLVGKAIRTFRKKVVLSTKCGIELSDGQVKVHNSPEYIKKSCEKSLQRLGTEVIDVYYLHRYNSVVPIEESMGAMLDLIKMGKILNVGLSEVTGDIVEKAHRVLGDHLVALQSEYSILNFKDAQTVLPTCRKFNLSFVAFSPLGRGFLTGRLKKPDSYMNSKTFDVRSIAPQFQPSVFEHNTHLVESLTQIAFKKGCTPGQLSLAWLLAQAEDIIPIPGTKRLEYLEENLGTLNVSLSPMDMAEIDKAIRENPIQGERLP